LSDWLIRNSKPLVVFTALAIFAIFLILVLPAQPKIGVTEDFDPGYPDLAFWYSPEHLYGIAEAYGPEGRMAYVRMRYRFDIIWPLVYVGFLTTSLSWVFGKVSAGSKISRINLLPVCAGLFDYLENLFASIVMLRYPTLSPGIDILAPFMTMLKWSLLSLSFLGLIAGSISLIIVKFRERVFLRKPE
jgi:hypothetical protein